MMSEELKILGTYCRAVFGHWWFITIEGILVIMDLVERALGTWVLPPLWVKLTIGIAVLIVAQYLAYRKLTLASALPDTALANHLRELITPISEDARRVLKLALLYEVIETPQMKIDGLSFDEIKKARQECVSTGLLRVEYEHVDISSPLAFAKQRAFYQVPQEFRETLKRLLYMGN
jgi:hypothetical protein